MKSLKYFPVLSLFLLIHSGLLKWLPFPIDPVILFLISTLLLGLKFIANTRLTTNMIVVIIVYMIFTIAISLTGIYTISDNYWKEKLFKIWLNFIFFLLPFIFFKNLDDWNNFKKVYFFFAVIAIIVLLFGYYKNELRPLLFEWEKYKFPEYISISLFFCVAILLTYDSPNSIVKTAFIFFCAIIIIIMGAKGPIVFLIISLIYLYGRKKLIQFSAVLILLTITLVFFTPKLPILERVAARFETFFFNTTADASSNNRKELMKGGLNTFLESPILGTGIGGFGKAMTTVDGRLSPHNIFLEVLAESGIIGGFLFLILIIITLISVYKTSAVDIETKSIILILKAISLLMALELMIASILEDIRIPLFWFGLLVCVGNKKNNKIS